MHIGFCRIILSSVQMCIRDRYKTLGFSLETKLKPRRWKELEKQKGTFMKSRSLNSIGLCFYHDNAGSIKLSQDVAYLGSVSYTHLDVYKRQI